MEVVEDLSEETFLKAFRRFVSCRSLPRKMVSDNATTYLLSAEELKHLLSSVNFIPKRALSRRITSLPHKNVDNEDIDDPDYGNLTEMTRRARRQALLLQHFRNHWITEYLTSLREFHKTTRNNKQTINIGDIVLVHDDIPRVNWKLAVIENLIDIICTSTGKTNRSQGYICSKYVQQQEKTIQLQ